MATRLYSRSQNSIPGGVNVNLVFFKKAGAYRRAVVHQLCAKREKVVGTLEDRPIHQYILECFENLSELLKLAIPLTQRPE
jgi:hypothetical protein